MHIYGVWILDLGCEIRFEVAGVLVCWEGWSGGFCVVLVGKVELYRDGARQWGWGFIIFFVELKVKALCSASLRICFVDFFVFESRLWGWVLIRTSKGL